MLAPQVPSRNPPGRDLAHEQRENAAAFLKRMRAVAPADNAAILEVEAAIEAHRQRHLVYLWPNCVRE
jgi:hypothetical protein